MLIHLIPTAFKVIKQKRDGHQLEKRRWLFHLIPCTLRRVVVPFVFVVNL